MKKYRLINCIGSLVIAVFVITSCEKDDSPKYPFLGDGAYQGEYFPTSGWRYCDPEEFGMDPEKLKLAHDYAANEDFDTDGYLIIKDGYIVAEDYFEDFLTDEGHASFSVAKSFTSSLIGIAIDKGYISGVDDKIADYFPQLQESGVQQEKKEITIRHLLTMTGGFEWIEDQTVDYSENDIFVMAVTSDDFINYVLSKSVINDPGTTWNYSSGESMLLSGVIQNATGKTAYEFAQENLLSPIGISNFTWAPDPAGYSIGGWGIQAPLKEYAKFGYLYLNNGSWDGTRVISNDWITESTTPASNDINYYGYQFWLADRYDNTSNPLPDDVYMAVGLFHQYIVVVPSENMIIVRMGNDQTMNPPVWDTKEFVLLILDAINA